MQHAEIDQDQQQLKHKIKESKDVIAVLTTQHNVLEQASLRSSPLMRRLGKHVGFGAAGKMGWVSFKLKFKQEELASLMTDSDERMNGTATLLSMVPKATTAGETTQQKMERMVIENPSALEPHIRRVYQSLIEAES